MGKEIKFLDKRYIINAAKDLFNVDITFNEAEMIRNMYDVEPAVAKDEGGIVTRFEYALMKYLDTRPAPVLNESERKVELLSAAKDYGIDLTGVQLGEAYDAYVRDGDKGFADYLVEVIKL